MFILELTYTAPDARVAPLLADHMAWVEKHYAAGVFIASGRKVPRDGGIMATTTAPPLAAYRQQPPPEVG